MEHSFLLREAGELLLLRARLFLLTPSGRYLFQHHLSFAGVCCSSSRLRFSFASCSCCVRRCSVFSRSILAWRSANASGLILGSCCMALFWRGVVTLLATALLGWNK